MPEGKPAGVRCIQLSDDNRCLLFGLPERPAVCISLRPTMEMCGTDNDEAYTNLILLEIETAPTK